MANFGFGEIDIPLIQNPWTNKNQGAVPILQKDWNGLRVDTPLAQQAPKRSAVNPDVFANDGATYTGGTSGGSSGGGAAPSYDPNVLAQFDQGIGVLNQGLSRLPGQLDIARSNINTQYSTNRNELDSGKNQAQASYTQSGNQNQQNFRTDKNAIADKSSMGLQGLLRMLGAYGAGGSSDARYVAPQAVTTQASQERAGAGNTFAQNQSGLDTNWNNFLSQDTNSRRKLDDWKNGQMQSAEAQSQTTKQDLLSKLADLAGQRAATAGGSYKGAAQPYLDQANALSGVIDNLGRLNPSYNGVTPVYNAPSLGDYTLGQGSAPMASNALEQSAAPFLSLLLGQQEDKKLGL